MAKILYPVGTAVQIRDWKTKEIQDETGVKLSTGKRIVTDYRKGESRPYVVSTVDDHGRNASKRFSVDEIKSYREAEWKHHEPINVYDRYPRTPTEAIAVEREAGITREEVNEIVAKANDALFSDLEYRIKYEVKQLHNHLVEDADHIAREVVHEHLLDEDE